MATSPSTAVQVTAMPSIGMKELCDLRTLLYRSESSSLSSESESSSTATMVALAFMYASWNHQACSKNTAIIAARLESLLVSILSTACADDKSNSYVCVVGSIQVDESEESMDCCLGDNGHHNGENPCPPQDLPVLVLAIQTGAQSYAQVQYVTDIRPVDVLRYLVMGPSSSTTHVATTINYVTSISNDMEDWSRILLDQFRQLMKGPASSIRSRKRISTSAVPLHIGPAIRIFIAGDRSSVGKSSVCLGLLGTLVQHLGYAPDQVAYIKPATQCEATQLVQRYCDSVGIACVPVGPLVYYKGFTRAFLAGETGETSESLLEKCGQAVDEVARGKRIVLVDGVGFPAVGSICGTDNAAVARACGYPDYTDNAQHKQPRRAPMGVVLVGGSGVGAAVDSFNLNATYFEQAHIPVLGGIFNKLSTEGFYSLENCKEQVTRYFDQDPKQQRLRRRPFGFIPQIPELGSDNPMDHLNEFFRIFHEHVLVRNLLDGAAYVQRHATTRTTKTTITTTDAAAPVSQPRQMTPPPTKKQKTGVSSNGQHLARTRQEIEQMAKKAGAAPSA